jgi:hypothetical protein
MVLRFGPPDPCDPAARLPSHARPCGGPSSAPLSRAILGALSRGAPDPIAPSILRARDLGFPAFPPPSKDLSSNPQSISRLFQGVPTLPDLAPMAALPYAARVFRPPSPTPIQQRRKLKKPPLLRPRRLRPVTFPMALNSPSPTPDA